MANTKPQNDESRAQGAVADDIDLDDRDEGRERGAGEMTEAGPRGEKREKPAAHQTEGGPVARRES